MWAISKYSSIFLNGRIGIPVSGAVPQKAVKFCMSHFLIFTTKKIEKRCFEKYYWEVNHGKSYLFSRFLKIILFISYAY